MNLTIGYKVEYKRFFYPTAPPNLDCDVTQKVTRD